MRRFRCLVLAAFAAVLAGCGGSQDVPSLAEEGMTAIEQGNYEGAISNFSASIGTNEDVLVSYRGTGMAYMGLEKYEEAVNAFDEALSLAGDKMTETRKDLLYYKASALYRQEDYSGTISVCDEILNQKGESDAYYLRGACYLELDEQEKAKANFDAAVGIAPEDYDLYLNIYECYAEKKLSAEGGEYLSMAMDIEPETKEDFYQRARIYYALEDYDSAKKELDSLVEEKDGPALLLMGQVYLAMEDYAHSKSMYQTYIETVGETPLAYNGMVLADLAQEDVASALTNIEKGLALEEENGKQELLFNEIVAYEQQQDFQTAREKAEAYVEAYPSDEAGQKEYQFLKTR